MTMLLPGLAGPVPHAQTTALVLAQQDEPVRDEDEGKASPVGLVVLILFLVAVVLLVRSMTKHLKRVPASFDKPEQQDGDTEGSEGSEGSAGKQDS
ncbi:MAG: hypothetical protein GEU97_16285 [Actinophytocola sp.]|nr:hypothetical protein [Actinophytocola sp.]